MILIRNEREKHRNKIKFACSFGKNFGFCVVSSFGHNDMEISFSISSKRLIKSCCWAAIFYVIPGTIDTLCPKGFIQVLVFLVAGQIVVYTWSLSNIEKNLKTHSTNGNPTHKITSFFHKAPPKKSSPEKVGSQKFQCSVCLRTFENTSGLISHNKSQHSFQPKYFSRYVWG